MTNITRKRCCEVAEDCEALSHNYAPLTHQHCLLMEVQNTIYALRDALDEAHKSGWDDAIEAAKVVAAEWEETFDKRGDDNASYGAGLCFRDIRALPYKPQEDVSDG